MIKKCVYLLSAGFIMAAPFAARATQYQVIERPRQECWNEQAAVQGGGDLGGAVIGGLAGGLLGHTVGGGNGRNAATAVGAVTGALIGDRGWGNQGGVQTVQKCRTVVDHVSVPVAEYYVPRPVVIQQQYYRVPAPVYRDDWRADQYRREQWRREHWEHDERERADWQRHEGREHHGHEHDD